MHDREDVYALTTHEIDDSIPAHENLPYFSPFIIGNESSDARELLQLAGGFEDAIGEQPAGATGVLLDKLTNLPELPPGREGPDYSGHSAISRSTSSWLTTSSASAAARPFSIFAMT